MARWLDRGRKGLSGKGGEGVGWVNGSVGGGGGWMDQWLDRGKRGLDRLMVQWFKA